MIVTYDCQNIVIIQATGLKGFPGTNTVAYFLAASVTRKKFLILTLSENVFQLSSLTDTTDD